MKRERIFLKIAILIIGLPILGLSIFALYWLANNPVNINYAYSLYPIIIGLYISSLPFYIALYNAFQLLNYIDRNTAFNKLSIRALRNIKHCAIAISSLYVIIIPFVYMVAEKDDAPGLIIFGMFPIFVSMVVAAFASMFEKILDYQI